MQQSNEAQITILVKFPKHPHRFEDRQGSKRQTSSCWAGETTYGLERFFELGLEIHTII